MGGGAAGNNCNTLVDIKPASNSTDSNKQTTFSEQSTHDKSSVFFSKPADNTHSSTSNSENSQASRRTT